MNPGTCIAPGCGEPCVAGQAFCRRHLRATASRRGGWLSAFQRRLAASGHDTEALDASNVAPRLWVGAAPPVDRRLEHFTVIALCAVEYQPPRASWTARIVRARLDDGDHPPSQAEVIDAVGAARQTAEELRRGGRVLVTCQKGWNRSALVASMAVLMLAPRMKPKTVIGMMRKRRSGYCLSNPHFVELLERVWSSRTPPVDRGGRQR